MEKLGINPIQILSYIIIFFALYFLARKFVKKVLDTTDERKKVIEEGLRNAEEANQIKVIKTKEAEAEKEKIIQKAYNHGDEIVSKAKEKESKIIEEARQKAQTVIEENKSELESLKQKSKEEGLKESKEIISLAIKKTFEGLKLDAKTEEKLIEESLNNLK